jgi:hypothetical protein
MVLDRLRRRRYLGGVVAAVTGLAGCNDQPTTTDEVRETDPATDTTTERTTQSVARHDHSGSGQGGADIAPRSVNTDVYAARMPGDDLSAKVRNAIDAVPTGGAVIVTPRADGEPWTWSDTLTINLNESGGLELLFRGTTMVEYIGDGFAIEVTYRPAEYGQLNRGDFLRLRGGNWRAPEGTNPDGWLRLLDVNFCEIRPERVIDFSNDERTGTGIRYEIQEIFCESHVVSGHFAACDIGLDFVPSDTPGIAGGEAAASFQGNYVDNVKLLNCRRYGIRWRDGAQCQQLTVVNPDTFAGISDEVVDDFVHYYLGGDFDGAMVLTPKAEDAGANNEAYEQTDTMFEVSDRMGTPPLVVHPGPDDNVDRLVDYPDRFATLPTLMMWDDGKRYRAGVHALGRRDSEPRFTEGGVVFPPQRFTGEGSVNPDVPGKVVFYDGTRDDLPAGLYRSDPANSRWVNLEDPSITYDD